ncbi:EamA family transporter [Candidatus Bathyarchaeota archaeon]|nr:EamA family transporter [Candidatus Bathyarchaeota archaeon]
MVICLEGWMYALLAVVCWGFEAIIVKAAGDGVDPLTGTGVGCVAAGLIFFVYLLGTGRVTGNIMSRSGLLYGLAGIVSFAVGHYLYYTAINKSGAALSASLVATYPLLTVIIAALFFGEPVTIKSGLGTLLIVIGGLVLLT